jgi:hypothetical protein
MLLNRACVTEKAMARIVVGAFGGGPCGGAAEGAVMDVAGVATHNLGSYLTGAVNGRDAALKLPRLALLNTVHGVCNDESVSLCRGECFHSGAVRVTRSVDFPLPSTGRSLMGAPAQCCLLTDARLRLIG